MPFGWVSAAGAVIGGLGAAGAFGGGGGGGGSTGVQASNAAADKAAQISQDQWDYFKQNYEPLESSLIDDAKAAGSPEEYARARGAANADVTGAFDSARKTSLNRMQSYGINPGSPAFQSAAASTDIAEGAAKAGAETQATNNVRNLAYSKALDVVGLGRNIPAQSAASSANAANAATTASRNAFLQNQTNQQNLGRTVGAVGNLASKWFGSNQNPNANYNSDGLIGNPTAFGDTYSIDNAAYGAKGGKVAPKGFMRRYARGGIVSKHPITPHMRFVGGGAVGRSGNAMPDQSSMGATIDNETGQVVGPGTGTSDSVPAQIDGQQPAALSNGEYVINKAAVDLTGEEMLAAINDAGLKKRQRAGLSPTQDSNDVPQEAGAEAYAEGGSVGLDDTGEGGFQDWYAGHAKRLGLNRNPDDPQHHYDYRAAYRAGATPDKTGHWPSQFKTEGHPRTFINEQTGETSAAARPGMRDTRRAYANGGRVGHRTVIYSGAGLGERNA